MKIVDILIGKIKIPLKRPFKTALRTVYFAEDIIVKLLTRSGLVGYGSAAPTLAITGESSDSIISCLVNNLKPKIIGADLSNLEKVMNDLHSSFVNNTSALAAVDMAFYDLLAQSLNLPLYKYLGGYHNLVFTDLTISANSPEVMVADSLIALDEGFQDLKLKLGLNPSLDFVRVQAVRTAVGNKVKISLDANQAWGAKEAVRIIRRFEKLNLNIEFVEQPVKAKKLSDLRYVTQNVETDILADESVFSPYDALQLIHHKACDLLNIKLAKAGGIFNATKILNIAEAAGVECIVGCMLESQISVTAAAHFAAAKKSIVRCDLDSPSLLAENPIVGGAVVEANTLTLSETDAGLGIKEVLNVEYLKF
ncbi:dipeptide epimerase [Fluviispira multicolorata]|uniref:Dipeptide epimerase n=1 Tax=Fluviispira multicolorata TaxID=2654512 RepID=A0A833JEK5_9BACT|nr:dipeptide epimerase [Fluviispira multicolorata]KAB8033261.1 dipeptide epimerase [Fluviispira multicolorata]